MGAKFDNILIEETNEGKKDEGRKQRERKQKIVLRETISEDDETSEDEEKEIMIKKKPTGKSKPGSMKNKLLKNMRNGRKFKPSVTKHLRILKSFIRRSQIDPFYNSTFFLDFVFIASRIHYFQLWFLYNYDLCISAARNSRK